MTDDTDSNIVPIKSGKGRKKRLISEMEQAAQESSAEYDAEHPVVRNFKTRPLDATRFIMVTRYCPFGVFQILYHNENWYSYHKGMWIKKEEENIRFYVGPAVEKFREEVMKDGKPVLRPFTTTTHNINEIINQMKIVCMVEANAPAAFIDGAWVPYNSHGKIICRGHVVDMLTGEVASNHNLFVPNGAEWTWDAEAKEPVVWKGFLKQLFGDKEDEIQLLQEWMGYGLSGDTWAQKGLIIVGPTRAGKGTIGHVLIGLLGASMVSSPSLKSLGNDFGLETLVDKRLCLINDAKLSTKSDRLSVIETMLRITAGDTVDVGRKFKLSVTQVLGARVMLLSNDLPDLADDSEAMSTRFMILKLANSFLGKEDNQLKEKLIAELPGIAKWCVEGYRRLEARGKFLEPESSHAERAQWRDENPLVAFVAECCTVEAGEKIASPVMYEVWCVWCNNNGVHPGPSNKLTQRIKAISPSITNKPSNSVNWLYGISAKSKI